jgi:hypothetical protein
LIHFLGDYNWQRVPNSVTSGYLPSSFSNLGVAGCNPNLSIHPSFHMRPARAAIAFLALIGLRPWVRDLAIHGKFVFLLWCRVDIGNYVCVGTNDKQYNLYIGESRF